MTKPSSFSWRPATTLALIVGLGLVLIALVVSFASSSFRPTTTVKIGSATYHVWSASTFDERAEGLSGVERLKANGGLLMDFQQDGNNGIWMKDMLMPIDIIWIDSAKKVIHIERNANPALGTSVTFMPAQLSRYVLEISAGSADRAAIKVGQTATFRLGDSQ